MIGRVNASCMIVAAVLCIVGGVIILYSGVAIWSVPYDKAVDDGTLTVLAPFISCKSQYDLSWNLKNATGYIPSNIARDLTFASCATAKAGSVALSAFTGGCRA
jgi:hypothetical protein